MACVQQAMDPLAISTMQQNFDDLFSFDIDIVEEKIDTILGSDWIQSVPVRNKDSSCKAELEDEKEEYLKLFGIQKDLDSYLAQEISGRNHQSEESEKLSKYLNIW
ncbi:hypothetical protein GUITHDRAFT_150545 [Guillardia theta CCMP2712]|uniref:Uncharacterized protein n=1 Tax=Guillardia theta (strain CCMP2712) TaxID=905079 RepID=L1JWE3_GUITC|nr:hypothetical protein GUITHDRAFT_150545 [Guillardia theta CCMP2712]EKX52413.1 hypothetical protein GUITHDRAFT_150545 [Guillardia theta CCMP2712]|eukprot:XP_005839393.1 hypothetical protein GUITHDRAFT_150545 [Guillardia theta CCMP2712]